MSILSEENIALHDQQTNSEFSHVPPPPPVSRYRPKGSAYNRPPTNILLRQHWPSVNDTDTQLLIREREMTLHYVAINNLTNLQGGPPVSIPSPPITSQVPTHATPPHYIKCNTVACEYIRNSRAIPGEGTGGASQSLTRDMNIDKRGDVERGLTKDDRAKSASPITNEAWFLEVNTPKLLSHPTRTNSPPAFGVSNTETHVSTFSKPVKSQVPSKNEPNSLDSTTTTSIAQEPLLSKPATSLVYDTSKPTCTIDLVCYRSGPAGCEMRQIQVIKRSGYPDENSYQKALKETPKLIPTDRQFFCQLRRVYLTEICGVWRRALSLKGLKQIRLLSVHILPT
jgi:hypothetical protein